MRFGARFFPGKRVGGEGGYGGWSRVFINEVFVCEPVRFESVSCVVCFLLFKVLCEHFVNSVMVSSRSDCFRGNYHSVVSVTVMVVIDWGK